MHIFFIWWMMFLLGVCHNATVVCMEEQEKEQSMILFELFELNDYRSMPSDLRNYLDCADIAEVQLWYNETIFTYDKAINRVCFNGQGNELAIAVWDDKKIHGITMKDKKQQIMHTCENGVRDISWAHNCDTLAVGMMGGGKVELVGGATPKKVIYDIPNEFIQADGVALDKDATTLAVMSSQNDGRMAILRVYNVTTGLGQILKNGPLCCCMALSDDGRYCAFGDKNTLFIAEQKSQGIWSRDEIVIECADGNSTIENLVVVCFDPTSRYLACGGDGGSLCVYDMHSTEQDVREKKKIMGNCMDGCISSLSFDTKGDLLAVAYDTKVKIFDVKKNQCIVSLPWSVSDVMSLSFASSLWLATGYSDGKLCLFKHFNQCTLRQLMVLRLLALFTRAQNAPQYVVTQLQQIATIRDCFSWLGNLFYKQNDAKRQELLDELSSVWDSFHGDIQQIIRNKLDAAFFTPLKKSKIK